MPRNLSRVAAELRTLEDEGEAGRLWLLLVSAACRVSLFRDEEEGLSLSFSKVKLFSSTEPPKRLIPSPDILNPLSFEPESDWLD